MLVNCPKCGFSQPQDKYCANCGIDMQAFRPKQPSAVSELLNSPIFMVILVVVIVAAAVIYVRKQRSEDLRQRMEYLQGGNPVVLERKDLSQTSPNASNNSQAEPNPNVATTQHDDPANTRAAREANPQVTGGEGQATKGNQIAGDASRLNEGRGGEASARQQTKILFYLAELPMGEIRKLAGWAQEGAAQGGKWQVFDEVHWGIVPALGKRISELQGITIYERGEKVVDGQSSNQQWFNGTQHKSGDPELALGLSNYIAVEETREHTLRINMEIQRAFREGNPAQIVRKSYPFSFELRGDNGFLVTGILPKKVDVEPDEEYSWSSFFKIFKSTAYNGRQSEFTLLYEFDRSGPSK